MKTEELKYVNNTNHTKKGFYCLHKISSQTFTLKIIDLKVWSCKFPFNYLCILYFVHDFFLFVKMPVLILIKNVCTLWHVFRDKQEDKILGKRWKSNEGEFVSRDFIK